MGYCQYCNVEAEYDKALFEKVSSDFKKMMQPLKDVGVILADSDGENCPIISPTEIRFNGLANCGHTKRDLGITWPAPQAIGVAKNGGGTQIQELTNSNWFAGSQLRTRVCDGDCSHEPFSLEQKKKVEYTNDDGSKRIDTPAGEYSEYAREDGTRDKTPANEVGKFWQGIKTAYKPYDLAVTICLVIAKHHLGSGITVHSDGTMENWQEAIQMCSHFLGYGQDFILDE